MIQSILMRPDIEPDVLPNQDLVRHRLQLAATLLRQRTVHDHQHMSRMLTQTRQRVRNIIVHTTTPVEHHIHDEPTTPTGKTPGTRLIADLP